jgi:hypothetical protein
MKRIIGEKEIRKYGELREKLGYGLKFITEFFS